jgi:mRNA interferase RelE/StbE
VNGGNAEGLHELRTTSTVRLALSKILPEAVATAAYEFITGPLLANPHRIGKRLLPPMDDRYSARRGIYRVIYRIDDKARMVTVVDVAHRSNQPYNLVTTDRSWASAIDRYREGPGSDTAIAQVNVVILSALRSRWEPVIDVEPSMFDLNMTPTGRVVRDLTSQLTWVQVRHEPARDDGSGLVKISLIQFTPRVSLAEPGGHVTIAGDLCRAEKAPVVVESFLMQIADPA